MFGNQSVNASTLTGVSPASSTTWGAFNATLTGSGGTGIALFNPDNTYNGCVNGDPSTAGTYNLSSDWSLTGTAFGTYTLVANASVGCSSFTTDPNWPWRMTVNSTTLSAFISQLNSHAYAYQSSTFVLASTSIVMATSSIYDIITTQYGSSTVITVPSLVYFGYAFSALIILGFAYLAYKFMTR